jgi:archaellum biogenesis protein FlaJ (TadC family)
MSIGRILVGIWFAMIGSVSVFLVSRGDRPPNQKYWYKVIKPSKRVKQIDKRMNIGLSIVMMLVGIYLIISGLIE